MKKKLRKDCVQSANVDCIKVPIVFVAHSMGGLVVKQDINEDFRHVCGDVRLWSFFEGAPTTGFIIVDKSSAVMNLPGEHTQYLSADHRHVCKFRDVNDPNYITLRDCFKTTIEQINKHYTIQQAQQMKMIADALDISHQPKRDLLSVSEKLHKGTCEWITQHEDFHRWLDVADASTWSNLDKESSDTHPRILWLSGHPGSGKSVTTSHVVNYLTSFNMDCCYFFFKNDTKLGIASLLLNLAYQMAEFSFEIRQVFLSIVSNGETVNTQDHTVIWNNLFQGRIFQVPFTQPFYWVIDGLDECPKKSLISLIQVLSRIETRIPIRIFMTSRPDSPDAPVEQLLNAENVNRVEFRTGQEDSIRDIAAYVRSQPRLSRMLDNDENDQIVTDILAKSQGNFLWASLIIGRLDELYSAEDVRTALRQVPSEMNGFYDRILESISNASNSEKAKCIMKWVVCAPEPLSTEELMEAVHLDIGHTLLAATSGDIFSEICGREFIDTKTLIWIEHVARKGKLKNFLRTIGNIKPYLARQLERSPPFSKSYQKVKSWVDDLTHLVSIFGQTLLDSPGSVYAFIPPLCPSSSLIHRTFARDCSQKVVCPSHKDWDERLSCMNFHSYSKSIAVSDNHIATGHTDGMIRIFSTSTFEEVAVLKHGSPVRQLAFGNVSNVLVSCSPKAISVWSTKQDLIWKATVPGVASSVCFNADDTKLMVTIKNDVKHAMLAFASVDGTQLEPMIIPRESPGSDSESDQKSHSMQKFCPEVACVSFSLGLVAVTWRTSHLTIFFMDSDNNLEKFCKLEKDGFRDAPRPPQILGVELNPAVESDLVAVAYQDGDIAIFEMDEWSPKQTHTYSLHTRTMASSPDGRTLAAGDTEGGIWLFAFDTLQLLYRINSLDEVASSIMFASNSLRLYDVRGRSCNVWEPSVLVRKSSMDDNSSEPEEFSGPLPEGIGDHSAHSLLDTKTITVIAPAHDDHYHFCGREDGSVTIHDNRNGTVVLEIKLHSVQICHLHFEARSSTLLSVDISSRCVMTRLERPSSGFQNWSQEACVMDHRAQASVTQSLMKPSGTAFLLSKQDGEELWNGREILRSKVSTGSSWWMPHPTDPELLLLVDNKQIRTYHWENLRDATEDHGLSIALPPNLDWQNLDNVWSSQPGCNIISQAVTFRDAPGTAFLILDLDQNKRESSSIVVSCTLRNMAAGVKSILAVSRSTVIFLDRGGWVCSLGVKNISEAKSYTRHFFIPPFWRARGDFMVKIVAKNSLVVAYKDDVVIVHGFMDFTLKTDFPAFLDEDDTSLVLRRRLTNL
ncbi:hypothetical protein J7T55_002502 [Diaporthe amygdali]|uniref:uncharacterized protein n=1 Tax=Phomopsis amygdali TaxID=1214568 RepID=UPI0022FEB344|nr:uncharacterized protein J7T55_002502 [Diaporthe amygdali]KAJ0121991.1 hypothetical protein J7T55_002502 [Diaporthe amygdali]